MAAARRAQAVITVSNQVAGELSERGVPSERIRVIPNAVGPEFTRPQAGAVEDVKAQFGLEDRYMIMVGWSDPRKDAATAVAAHRAVVDAVPHQLVLVGSAHRNFAPVKTPAGRSIRILGYVSDAALPALLAGAVGLLYPSRYEGFGLPPVEALACGTPALVSDLPAIREATGGKAVYLPAGDVAAWTDALRSALRGEIRPGSPPRWTWEDAGRTLADLLTAIAPPADRRTRESAA
jgi:glycosyltransferase involved in cell wall biosynthesis